MTGQSFDFRQQLGQGCDALGIVLDAAAVERLFVYFTELTRWGRKINLIAKGTPDAEILEKHFLDSLTLLPLLDVPGAHLAGPGRASGFEAGARNVEQSEDGGKTTGVAGVAGSA